MEKIKFPEKRNDEVDRILLNLAQQYLDCIGQSGDNTGSRGMAIFKYRDFVTELCTAYTIIYHDMKGTSYETHLRRL